MPSMNGVVDLVDLVVVVVVSTIRPPGEVKDQCSIWCKRILHDTEYSDHWLVPCKCMDVLDLVGLVGLVGLGG